MTDENRSNETRRTFMKGAAAAGAAATGITAFSGSAAAQPNIDTEQFNVVEQDGEQTAAGLLVVQAQNIVIQDVLEVVVGRDVVNIDNFTILSDNVVQIAITDSLVEVVGTQAQIAVTVLGQTTQGNQRQVTRTIRGRTRVDQQG